MTFETIRLILIMMEIGEESGFDDYRVIFYSFNPDHIFNALTYSEIPECFNCKVKAFEIDFDAKIMYIKSEVVKHDKIQ